MDELNSLIESQPDSEGAQIFLATVGSQTNDGLTLIFDGTASATEKAYKCLNLGRGSPGAGSRVVVLKISGTYVVLGAVAAPLLYYSVTDLASSATTQNIIDAINRINLILRYNGLASGS